MSAGYPASLHFESTMKGGNPKIHTPSDTFDFISVDRVIEFMKIAIGFATELSLFQQSSIPTLPTPTPGKPVAPQLIFASQGEPQAIGSLLSKAPVLISYDMARMTKACEELTVCWKVGMFGSKSCNTVKAIQSSEISIVVNSSGTVNFSFESFGANGSCAKDSGYQFKFL